MKFPSLVDTAKPAAKKATRTGEKGIGTYLNQITIGDALTVLKDLPDASVDLVIADPPYNLSKGNSWSWNQDAELAGFGGKWKKVMQEWDNYSLVDYFHFTQLWATEVKRVLKPTGSLWVFGSYHNSGIINVIFQILDIEILNEIVWYKRNAFPNLSGRRLTASHETILWAHVGKKRQYYFDYETSKSFSDASDLLKVPGKQMRTVWDIPNNKEKSEIQFGKHPTQKPLRLCKRMISLSTKKGDIVLAPFAGVGSECIAALQLKRKFIGIEIDKKYATIAKKRLAVLPKNI